MNCSHSWLSPGKGTGAGGEPARRLEVKVGGRVGAPLGDGGLARASGGLPSAPPGSPDRGKGFHRSSETPGRDLDAEHASRAILTRPGPSGVSVCLGLDLTPLSSWGGAFPAAWGAGKGPDGGTWRARACTFQGSGTAHDTSLLDGALAALALRAWAWDSLKLDPCGAFLR